MSTATQRFTGLAFAMVSADNRDEMRALHLLRAGLLLPLRQ